MSATHSVRDYYAGRDIFLTGATGFIGKVLVEKVLRSCPDVRRVYILLRPKKGASVEERLKAIVAAPLFDILRGENAKALDKIVPIVGDCSENELGLSAEDRQTLVANVSFVFHFAANVRFDDPLRNAILLNVRGTREVCRLALEMRQLVAIAHLSTSYCQVPHATIEERIYPPYADWRRSIDLAERFRDEHTLRAITPLFMAGFPNSYTFTKSLAENVVHDLLGGKVHTYILRPSIVLPTKSDPFPGWLDNLNGPAGILIAIGKGVMRIGLFDDQKTMDLVPVDYLVRGVLASPHIIQNVRQDSVKRVHVMNGSNNQLVKAPTNAEMIQLTQNIRWTMPLEGSVWYPDCATTSNYLWYYINVLLFHVLPAVFVDTLLRVTGNKPMLLKIQRKIYTANMALQYFMMNQWDIKNNKIMELMQDIDHDEDFRLNMDAFDQFKVYVDMARGAKKFMLKENVDNVDRTIRIVHVQWYVDRGVKLLAALGLVYYCHEWLWANVVNFFDAV